MYRYLILISILIIFCKNKDSVHRISSNGHPFEFLVDKPGQVIQLGQIAHCAMQMWVGDSLVLSSAFNGNLAPVRCIPKENIAVDDLQHDIIAELSLGDSITCKQPMDSMSLLKYKFTGVTEFTVVMKVEKIVNEEDNEAYMQDVRKTKSDSLLAGREYTEKLKSVIQKINLNKINNQLDSLINKPSGLSYYILENGKGEPLKPGYRIHFHLFSMLSDGSYLNSSWISETQNYVILGNHGTIEGLEEALKYLKVGDKAVLFIPYPLAYGEDGSGYVPPKSDMVVYVEIQKMIPIKLNNLQ